jgi:hypothetical protein
MAKQVISTDAGAGRHRRLFAGRPRRRHGVHFRPDPAGSGHGQMVEGDIDGADPRSVRQPARALRRRRRRSGSHIAVKLTVFLTDLVDFAAVNAVMAEYFQAAVSGARRDRRRGAAARRAVEVDAILVLADRPPVSDACRACPTRGRSPSCAVSVRRSPKSSPRLGAHAAGGPVVPSAAALRGPHALAPIRALLPGRVVVRRSRAGRGGRDRLPLPAACLRVTASATSRTDMLTLRFFHFSAAQAGAVRARPRLRCYGEARSGAGRLEIVHPEYQQLGAPEQALERGARRRSIPPPKASARPALRSSRRLAVAPCRTTLRSNCCRRHCADGAHCRALREALLDPACPPPGIDVAAAGAARIRRSAAGARGTAGAAPASAAARARRSISATRDAGADDGAARSASLPFALPFR